MPVPSRNNGIVSVDSDDESKNVDNSVGGNDILESELKKIHELESQPLDNGNDNDSD